MHFSIYFLFLRASNAKFKKWEIRDSFASNYENCDQIENLLCRPFEGWILFLLYYILIFIFNHFFWIFPSKNFIELKTAFLSHVNRPRPRQQRQQPNLQRLQL